MRLSVCIDMLLRDLPVAERIRSVKHTGISAIEFWSWENKDINELEAVANRYQVEIAAFCTKFVSLVDPAMRDEYIAGLKETIPVARRLACSRLITQVGNELTGVPREKQLESLVGGLKACVPILAESRVTLLVEPLNVLVDHKGYFLYSSQEAFDVVREVNSPYVKVLYDIYHQQVSEGNLIPTIQSNIDLIGHLHVADHPGRHEPGTGEINYRNVFKAIAETGYAGLVGLEFRPTSSAIEALEEVVQLLEGL